jgi:hypothetical protein
VFFINSSNAALSVSGAVDPQHLERQINAAGEPATLSGCRAILVLPFLVERPSLAHQVCDELSSLRQRIRPVGMALAKMEIRASRVS